MSPDKMSLLLHIKVCSPGLGISSAPAVVALPSFPVLCVCMQSFHASPPFFLSQPSSAFVNEAHAVGVLERVYLRSRRSEGLAVTLLSLIYAARCIAASKERMRAS